MKNRKVNDMKFFKEVFSEFDKNKRGLLNTRDNPHNYNYVKDIWSKTYLYELGYKFSYTMLTTDSHEQKQRFVNMNYHFSKKYLTIYPKSAILGEKQNKDFQKPVKKIGDISFEEDPNPESENIKNLKRLGPDNLTEEWIKENLNSHVDILRLENHYWISKDLISKLGRLGTNLKVKIIKLTNNKITINNKIGN
jgi:hypothetical protein